MHICFLSHEYPLWGGGGVGSFIQTLGRQLTKKGHRISVLGITRAGKEERYTDQGVSVYRMPMSRSFRFKFYGNAKVLNQKLRELHAQHPIDILETSELGLAFIDPKLPFKKIIRMHGGHRFFSITLGGKPALWRSWQEKRSFQKADHLIAVSRFVGETTMKLLNTPTRRFQVIYNPIDTASFYEASPEKAIPGNLLFVGTVCEKKGVRQLIESMPYVKKKYPDVKLNIVGKDWHHPKTGKSYIEKLKNELTDAQLTDVNFVGPIAHDQIPTYLEKAQLCVYPSHMEAMPIAWLEVLAMAKPFVCSRIGPGLEAVEDGKTGLLCDPYNPEDIAEKINFMLGNPGDATKMGLQARQDVLHRFSIDKLVDENIKFYEQCLTG